MTGINVLSTGVSAKTKEEGFSSSEKAQVSSDSTMMEFAAILSGWVAQASGQGQNSGYQSNEPAGKEANSGRNAISGLDGLQVLIGTIQGYGNPGEVPAEEVQGKQVQNLETILAQLGNWQREVTPSIPMGNKEEANQAGMPSELPLGKNSPQSELDLYKGVISELLKEMSGKIKEKNQINPEFLNASAQQKLVLAAQRMNSGLFTQVTGEIQFQPVSESIISPIPSAAINLENDVLFGKGLLQDATLAKLTADTNITINTNMNTNVMNTESTRLSSQGDLVPADQQSTVSLITEKGVTPENKIGARRSGQENLDSVVLQKQVSMPPKLSINEVMGVVQHSTQEGVLPKEVQQEKGTSLQPFSLEVTNAQDHGAEGAGIFSQAKENVQLNAKVETKADIPIWAQVARDIHEKAFQARPHIRELDIQLHPAELGQIRLSLRWEDGQVHVRMTASELGTGQMLQSNLSELKDSLSQLGIQCGMLEMGLGDQQKNPRDQQGQGASTQARDNREESQEVKSSLEWDALSGIGILEAKDSRNRINVTA